MSKLIIEGKEARAESPEGATAAMPLADFLARLGSGPDGARTVILPDGVKVIQSRGPIEIWIHQTDPQVHILRWIADDSPVRFGTGTTYRTVKIALPYLITVAVFAPGEGGRQTLSGNNECFFANQPLRDWTDPLCYPALLNCSKYVPGEGKPLSWICTQHLDRSFDAEPDLERRKLRGFSSLMSCLLEAGFNYSSEHHEASSWFTESNTVDSRIATIDAWQQATEGDPLFALDVPWIPTGLTLLQIVDRVFSLQQAARRRFDTAADLGRIVFDSVVRSRRKIALNALSPFQELAASLDSLDSPESPDSPETPDSILF